MPNGSLLLSIVALFLLALLATRAPAQNLYCVDATVGDHTVTGTITTNATSPRFTTITGVKSAKSVSHP